MQSTIPCNLCGKADVEVLAGHDRDNNPLQTVICKGCGLVWTDPRPSVEETRTFYADEYRRRYKSVFQPAKKHVYRDTSRALERFERIRPLLKADSEILDIGAGAGFFPYVVMRNGYAVTGLEPNDGYAQYARQEFKLDIQVGFIQDVSFEDNGFDIITLNHVLEHLEDPYRGLVRIFRWLKPGGRLIVEVPNIEATYHAPNNKFHLAHLYTFNPENLKRLGEKAGYTVRDLQVVAGTDHINIIFQKPENREEQPVNNGSWEIPGNYSHIRKIYDGHTTLSHYTSSTPYLRFLHKNYGYIRERLIVSKFSSGNEIAEYLIKQHAA